MAHVGHELRLVLAGDFKLAALLGDLAEQAGILERDSRLVGEALHQADDSLRELARAASLQEERTERTLGPEQRNDQGSVQTRFERSVP